MTDEELQPPLDEKSLRTPSTIEVDYGPGAETEEEYELLPEIEGQEILDIHCGGGQSSVWFAQQGGIVTGIEESSERLSYAEKLSSKSGTPVEFLNESATELTQFDDGQFDIAFSSYSLHQIEDIEACFKATHRVLNADGTFVFSMPHPMYQLVNSRTHVVENSYFSTGTQVERIEQADKNIITFHHTISQVHNALSDAGFTVEKLIEPGSSDPREYEETQWKFQPSLMSKVPSTLIIKATKN